MDADQTSQERLAYFFRRNGYVRRSNPKRMAEGSAKYKKGDEVRLAAYSEAELAEMRALLAGLRFRVGNSYKRHAQWIQPIYGRAEVARFMSFVGEGEESK